MFCEVLQNIFFYVSKGYTKKNCYCWGKVYFLINQHKSYTDVVITFSMIIANTRLVIKIILFLIIIETK
jgi:hypothetical protein